MANEGLLVQSKHKLEIDVTPNSTPTFERVAKGFSGLDPSMNEETDQTAYLDGDGYLTTTVMGGQYTTTLSGHRYYGDPAQDFIFSKRFGLGNERETTYRITEPDGTIIEGPCTLAEITGASGDANAKGEITVAIHFNGKPAITSAGDDTTAPTVTVTPSDGATGVAVTTDITWAFDEAIRAEDVNDGNFYVMDDTGAIVAGTLSHSANQETVTFSPSADLTATTDYTAIASKNIRDIAGNNLANTEVTNFTTA
ncbi:phage tail tube protein [Gracilibacillus thailandensis]|uniref:phage tail tube protein n=1 Tax=Gracilibacillus thailandensis TaxID=563735 RepID=UPI0013D4F724|nr:Ig-like domain-containing protein [Gracilibacillus thailandensis]